VGWNHVLTSALGTVIVVLSLAAPSAAPARSLPPVRVEHGGFVTPAGPLRVYGFNYLGDGENSVVLDYFAQPGRGRLAQIRATLREARRLGANTVRVYLELSSFMRDAEHARPRALRALRRVLSAAERAGVYLDLTGNLVWRPERSPAWYEALKEPQRWHVQALFWQAVAHVAARSPAVLCYELASEPAITPDGASWYTGEVGGYAFVQFIAIHQKGRNLDDVARMWTALMAAAVHGADPGRMVTIGLLPLFDWPFDPANVADLLDFVTVHEYPRRDGAADSIATVRRFAATGKPVLLGETFALNGVATQEAFLRGARRYLAGSLSFFDGTGGREGAAASRGPRQRYLDNLRTYLGLRRVLKGRGSARAARASRPAAR
jgi:hypothetical protein